MRDRVHANPGKWVESELSRDIHWRIKYTPNRGGSPSYQVAYDGQRTHRKRRGKLVEIPPKWRGHVTHPQTIRKRQPVSRRTRKENR